MEKDNFSKLAGTPANRQRIEHVEECFGKLGKPLWKEGRALLGEGILTKLCRKKPKPRQFFLFNDILIYGTIVVSKKRYASQHIFDLATLSIDPLEDEGAFRNAWQFRTPSKSFTVFTATEQEKLDWIAHITRAIADLETKGVLSPGVDTAAVWVPNDTSAVCMHCYKTKFSSLSRRHHCRNCGAVVCAPCSRYRYLLINISARPVRVCFTCYQLLIAADENRAKSLAQGQTGGSGAIGSANSQDASVPPAPASRVRVPPSGSSDPDSISNAVVPSANSSFRTANSHSPSPSLSTAASSTTGPEMTSPPSLSGRLRRSSTGGSSSGGSDLEDNDTDLSDVRDVESLVAFQGSLNRQSLFFHDDDD